MAPEAHPATTGPATRDLEALARDHLRTILHGFLEWHEDEFQAAIDRNGSAVARHEYDHTTFGGDFTDFDDAEGYGEHAHEHKPGDPLRTWGGAS